MIDGIPVSYSLNARNIMSVLGKVVIYKYQFIAIRMRL